ncbi:hypothetical protein V5799_008213, partial [Amblyomma americanum]
MSTTRHHETKAAKQPHPCRQRKKKLNVACRHACQPQFRLQNRCQVNKQLASCTTVGKEPLVPSRGLLNSSAFSATGTLRRNFHLDPSQSSQRSDEGRQEGLPQNAGVCLAATLVGVQRAQPWHRKGVRAAEGALRMWKGTSSSSWRQQHKLELLNKIAEDIGDDAPWEESMQSGEDGFREDKINRFKDCLENVLLKQPPNSAFNEFMCPKTWDGWTCWNDTLPGSTAYAPCPQFVAGFVPYRQAHKVCTPNGTWFRHPITGNVWSNYTACVDTHDLQYRNLVNSLYVAGYAVSLVALISSLFIFINFRSLRCKRITIHKNLFASFVITNLCWILWYLQVVAGAHVIEKNPVWCQALHVVTQYFLLCNYLWMFCEGLYLHTLLVLAFIAEDKILKWFLLIGWGTCLHLCWVEHDIWYTYILSIPVCLSILLSFAFLVNIVRVLVTKLRAVDSPDSENIRKAARATLILLPLLGLHYVVTPFRPERDRIFLVYEVFSALVTSLQ